MSKEQKLRFLLYILSTVESMFEHSLVALNVETLLELSLIFFREGRLWIIYGLLSCGIPAGFLLMYIIVWESSGNMTGILGLALFEGVLPAVIVSIMASAIYVISRRKKNVLTEDCLIRVKALVLINAFAFFGMSLNLLLFSINASVVLDDLVDALIKLCIPISYLMVQHEHFASELILSSLNVEQTPMEQVVNPIVF